MHHQQPSLETCRFEELLRIAVPRERRAVDTGAALVAEPVEGAFEEQSTQTHLARPVLDEAQVEHPAVFPFDLVGPAQGGAGDPVVEQTHQCGPSRFGHIGAYFVTGRTGWMATFVVGTGIPHTASPDGGRVEVGSEFHQTVQVLTGGRSDLLHYVDRASVAVDRGQDRSSSS